MPTHETELGIQKSAENKEDKEKPFNPEHAADYAGYVSDFLHFIVESNNPTMEEFGGSFPLDSLEKDEREYLETALRNYQFLLKQTQEVETALTSVLTELDKDINAQTKGRMLAANILKMPFSEHIRLVRKGAIMTILLEDQGNRESAWKKMSQEGDGEILPGGALFPQAKVSLEGNTWTIPVIFANNESPRLLEHERLHLFYTHVFRIPEGRKNDEWNTVDETKEEFLAYITEGCTPEELKTELHSPLYQEIFARAGEKTEIFQELFSSILDAFTKFYDRFAAVGMSGIFEKRLVYILMNRPLETFPQTINDMESFYAQRSGL